MTRTALEKTLADVLGTTPERIVELEGGQIGSVFRVSLANGRTVVAKTGNTPLATEAFMLEYLAEESYLPVPSVVHASDELLLMEYIDGSTTHDEGVARDAARQLASLHEIEGPAYGFPRDTLTGPVRQPNPWTESWLEFYRTHRLHHAGAIAANPESGPGTLPEYLFERLEKCIGDLESILEEPPQSSLIHGDVWRTNVLSRDGRVTGFLDPATYYADPEIELAYIDWTDTFGPTFFDAYERERSIRDGFWERRRFVYRVYPLLVHVHLFGGSYVDELEATLERLGY
ncbi:fructosamine kinase family protein [Natronosalvus hydrolyticus]|uniref:fructosamine kinase family protein n=1 Tax=Natronosalvus hydrolyticus TaxID=2979988 RepID=UPI003CCC4A5E